MILTITEGKVEVPCSTGRWSLMACRTADLEDLPAGVLPDRYGIHGLGAYGYLWFTPTGWPEVCRLACRYLGVEAGDLTWWGELDHHGMNWAVAVKATGWADD